MEFETFDFDLLKMIDNIMPTTMQENLNTVRGTFSSEQDSWSATLDESTAINSVSYDSDSETVSIQFVNQSRVYQYATDSDTAETLKQVVISVIANDDGSVGATFNSLQRNNKLNLI
jgi:hypothetical protein